jgi:hypothetical protein
VWLEMSTMPEHAANHDLIELDPSEHFDIPDLTEEEWDTFTAALER